MDAGRLAASGTHEHLIETDCLYAEIAASQLLGGDETDLSRACLLDQGGEA